MTDDAGFFRNLSGLATDWVRQKRKTLQSDPETNVDATGGGHRYSFGGQELTWEDLRDIKDIRDSGGQVAQLMSYKALLNFGEGAEIHAETEDDEPLPEQVVDGEPMDVIDWIEMQFPHLDLMVLELGEDALWYPAAYGELRENRAEEFKDALPAEPWTILPMQNDQGEIIGYQQRTKNQGGGYTEQTLDADALWSIILNRRSARDKTGISEVLRNKEEIQAFKENEQAINQAIELHGFPQRHVKVGKEDGAPVRDDDLRRVRTIFDPRTTDANTAYFTGQDVDVESLEAENFDFAEVHEMDMRNLTTALGLPLEAGNVGSDGLGSGKPAELRFALLKLAIKANQRSFGVQFVEQIIKPAVRDYSPFECPNTVTLEIADPLEDIGEVADLIGQIGDYMTNDEIRRKLDLPEPEDDEIGESYRSPADIESAEEGDGSGGDISDMGFFSAANTRELQEVPDNAVSISDRSEAPEDANVIEGPGGGLYYVPSGGDGNQPDGGGSAAGRGDDPNPSVDLENEVDSMSLDDAGIQDGSNRAQMRVAQLEDGGEVFVEEGYDDDTAERELAGVSVYEQLDLPIPDHHYYEDSNEMAKEGIDGQTLRDAARDGGFETEVDEESVIDAYAASLIAGDTDMHGGNMMIREDGTAIPVDVEGSGGPVRDKSDQQNKIETMLDNADIDVEYDDIWNRAQELAGDIDPDAIPEGDTMMGEIAGDNIRENIEAIQA